MSTANQILSSARTASARSLASAALAPFSTAFAAARIIRPIPPAPVRESQTTIRSPPLPSAVSLSRA